MDYNILRGWGQPRNWFKAAREGSWTKTTPFDNTMYRYFLYTVLLFIILATFVGVDITLFYSAIFYILLMQRYDTAMKANMTNRRATGEVLGWGSRRRQRQYLTLAAALSLAWILTYYAAASDVQRQAVIPAVFQTSILRIQSIEPLRLLGLSMIGIIAVSIAESLFLAGYLLPSLTRYIGIIPGIAATSIFRGIVHYVILIVLASNGAAGEIIDVYMAIIFGLIFYPYVLREKTAAIAVYGHMIVNTVAYLSLGSVLENIIQNTPLLMAAAAAAYLFLVKKR